MIKDEWGRPIRKRNAIDIIAREAYPMEDDSK